MALTDTFNRPIDYLRLSVTDRCDFRCVYCMSENMQFLPRKDILTIEEMTQLAQAFTELGVRKIRITGGEPLVRRNVQQLLHNLGQLPQLQELVMTTNGSQLKHYTPHLIDAGIERINVSLDSLRPDKFKALTRTGDLHTVLEGIEYALDAGLHIKLNSVILKQRNVDEVIDLVRFAVDKTMDISFIEEMPLGIIDEHQRQHEFISSTALRKLIQQEFTLIESNKSTGGPSRYWGIKGSTSMVGFISPHSDNFCSDCNRIRVTAEGQLLLCLGNEHSVDLRKIIRNHPNDSNRLQQTIIDAMQIKPEKHEFDLAQEPQILRFMNMTGG